MLIFISVILSVSVKIIKFFSVNFQFYLNEIFIVDSNVDKCIALPLAFSK